MRKVLIVLSKTIAVIFAILFVIAAVLAILLFNIERKLFAADLYKDALADQQIYERLPGIVGNLLTTSIFYNPCAENPLLCEDISPDLRGCYEQTLGNERYVTLASGKEKPTEAEMQAIQPCLDQYGGGTTSTTSEQPSGENPLPTAPPDVQACVKQAIGETAYNELYNSTRAPTEAEIAQITPCFGQNGMGNFGNLGGGDQGGMPPFMKNLKASDWEAIINILVPPNELQAITENVLDQVFAYLNGETDSASVSLVKLKSRLAGQAGQDALLQLITAQPPCTDEQLVQMAAGALGGEQGMVICNPPEVVLALLLPELQSQLNALLTEMPDEAIIIKPSSQPVQRGGGEPLGDDPITALRNVRFGSRLSPLLPLGLLMLVTIFGVRSLKGWMRWWGIPFFFAGAIALIPGIAILPALNWAWVNFAAPRIPPIITADIVATGRNLVTYILHYLAEQIAIQSAVLLTVGLAAWIGSYFIKTGRKENIPAIPPPPTMA
ncbi:MAG: hypothetical protein COY47_03380 [Chloroflexi bacterium CG_4_10_14_0_8_um_filter_57_5]|nr:MAG: hypothetical protein COY47_03380 [Chloroflexi bacterium CG_4_10_14_0_8_um_filter_57_5]